MMSPISSRFEKELTSNTQRWGGAANTLESILHQATATSSSSTLNAYSQSHQFSNSMDKWDHNASMQDQERPPPPPSQMQVEQGGKWSKREMRSESDSKAGLKSSESSRSLKSARIAFGDDDSAYHNCSENQDGERPAKGESCRSQSSARRSRAAAVHNLSERRRRDRINEKMKALQKLVPNASKTDKASMLDEVIEYLKQLQAQVHIMSNARNMGMRMGMQQQLQMSLLARMGMGMGMGMIDVNLARNLPPSFPPLMHGGTTPFGPPPFTLPPVVPPPSPLKPKVDAATDAYNSFLAQSMNMEFLNKMSAIYRQQSSSQQPSKD